ncbi:hypothetical protein F5887DRAFT_995595, partial [Amanita rubescens]
MTRIILPEVITMGTITRRAIEKTWLTASNAKQKPRRVRTESDGPCTTRLRDHRCLCGLGRAVDLELHGRCAVWYARCDDIGVDTLEGTKSAGTDLHSKTAKVLDLSRDQA